MDLKKELLIEVEDGKVYVSATNEEDPDPVFFILEKDGRRVGLTWNAFPHIDKETFDEILAQTA